MTPGTRLVLASQSASRAAMLEAAGVAFVAVPAGIDEDLLKRRLGSGDPAGLALSLAAAKAQTVAEERLGDLVLGSDSLVEVDGRLFDKPARAADHRHIGQVQPQIGTLYRALHAGGCGGHDVVHIDPVAARRCGQLQPRQLQQVADMGVQPPGLFLNDGQKVGLRLGGQL